MLRCAECDHFNPSHVQHCERCGTVLSDPDRPETGSSQAHRAGSLEAEVLSLVQTNGKIAAIKLYRQRTGEGLKESREAVEDLIRRHNVTVQTSGCASVLLLVAVPTAAAWAMSVACR